MIEYKEDRELYFLEKITMNKLLGLSSRAHDIFENEHESLGDEAVDLIAIMARDILKSDPDLNEFIMAMGTFCFTGKAGSKYDMDYYTDEEYEEYMENGGLIADRNTGIIHSEALCPEFYDIANKLNDEFNVFGCPMRFKANTKIVRDWGIKSVVYEDLD